MTEVERSLESKWKTSGLCRWFMAAIKIQLQLQTSQEPFDTSNGYLHLQCNILKCLSRLHTTSLIVNRVFVNRVFVFSHFCVFTFLGFSTVLTLVGKMIYLQPWWVCKNNAKLQNVKTQRPVQKNAKCVTALRVWYLMANFQPAGKRF